MIGPEHIFSCWYTTFLMTKYVETAKARPNHWKEKLLDAASKYYHTEQSEKGKSIFTIGRCGRHLINQVLANQASPIVREVTLTASCYDVLRRHSFQCGIPQSCSAWLPSERQNQTEPKHLAWTLKVNVMKDKTKTGEYSTLIKTLKEHDTTTKW